MKAKVLWQLVNFFHLAKSIRLEMLKTRCFHLKKEDDPDDFYDVTVNDLRSMISDLQRQT
jgi:hypothetical protein